MLDLCSGDSVSGLGSLFQGFARSGSIFIFIFYFLEEDKSGRGSLVGVTLGLEGR